MRGWKGRGEDGKEGAGEGIKRGQEVSKRKSATQREREIERERDGESKRARAHDVNARVCGRWGDGGKKKEE